ncbi:transcription elongation factor 1 [Dunaliella salina]|uniref:Transcription elongation factor 1 homolog n=1 Tax=Dunaliella salina TaxID=3046 RepID=A0ABQ7GZH4_DUNSA|nr:transcription elongation factor 1 [Dunaliella salina]|eukprot:KAF5840005.1 transcription elongation factor 1 [Dunaliella salina]
MGKRKSSKPPPKKQAQKLDTMFNCPFCNSSKSVSCNIDHDKEMANMHCSQCPMKFECRITHLTEPIDVYHNWLDKCEEANA